MTEPTPLDKAIAAAGEAADDSRQLELMKAVVMAQTIAQAMQQPSQQQACQHPHKPGRSTGEWMAIGCAVCVGSIGLAFASIAIGIGAISVAILALVLRAMWRDYQKGR